MTMDELVGDVAALIDTALASASITATVEMYHRLEPPTALRVQVLEGDEGESPEWGVDLDQIAGGSKFSRMYLAVVVEVPWDEDRSTATALDNAVETIKSTIETNRDITADDGDDAAVGKYGAIIPSMNLYPGHPKAWVKARTINCSWRV